MNPSIRPSRCPFVHKYDQIAHELTLRWRWTVGINFSYDTTSVYLIIRGWRRWKMKFVGECVIEHWLWAWRHTFNDRMLQPETQELWTDYELFFMIPGLRWDFDVTNRGSLIEKKLKSFRREIGTVEPPTKTKARTYNLLYAFTTNGRKQNERTQ